MFKSREQTYTFTRWAFPLALIWISSTHCINQHSGEDHDLQKQGSMLEKLHLCKHTTIYTFLHTLQSNWFIDHNC